MISKIGSIAILTLILILSFKDVKCDTVEKELDLKKDYSYCTFTVTGDNLEGTSGYVKAPNGIEYQLSYVQNSLVTTVNKVARGKWKLFLESESNLANIKMSVDANTMVSQETQVDDTEVVKKITNLKSYLEDNTVRMTWKGISDESVVISVSNANTSESIVSREVVKGNSWDYELSDDVDSVIVTIVPYEYISFDNAKTSFLLNKQDLPKADIVLSAENRTNESEIGYEIISNDKFFVYGNGEECKDGKIPLIEGNNVIVVKVIADNDYISTYEYEIFKDTTPPIITLNQDINNITVDVENMELSGTVKDAVSLMIQGNNVTFNDEGDFKTILNFKVGSNEVIIKAEDNTGNVTECLSYVTRIEVNSFDLIKTILSFLIPLIGLGGAGFYFFSNYKKVQKGKMNDKEDELERTKKELDIEKYNATHDELTKCKNRKAYERDGKEYNLSDVCVIAFDVNNLKWTNDTLGHKQGDKLLTTISTVLQNKYENVYRMGGDEFNVLLKTSEFNEETLLEIDELLKIYTENDKQNIVYQVAHGYAFGDGSKSISEIWKIADSRMYTDKQEKKAMLHGEEEPKENASLKNIDKILNDVEVKNAVSQARVSHSEVVKESVNVTEIKEKKFNFKKIFAIIPFAFTLFLIWFILNKILFFGEVTSESMLPTYKVGDMVVGSRIYYDFYDVKRGDTVFVKASGEILGKRIVAIANDEVSFQNGYLCVNGDCLNEEYLSDETETNGVGKFNVPDNAVFLLGDNRENSLDSRYWENPYISEENIIAKNLLLIPSKLVLPLKIGCGIILLLIAILSLFKRTDS